MWKEVYSSEVDCSTQQFLNALQVWINKPHTVNRRLVGSQQIATEDVKIDITNDKAESLQRALQLDDIQSEFIRELVPKQLGRFHGAVERVIQYTNSEGPSCAFLPLVHTNEEGARVHADNSLAYTFLYNKSKKRLIVRVSETHEEPPCTSQGLSVEWLTKALIPKLITWSKQESLSVETSSLKLMPVDVYTLKYQYLKNKYGLDLVKRWPEQTDPRKFVFEDVAIAAYLMVLWEEEQRVTGSNRKQTFVDMGCGNGLLVHILAKEGYKGVGLDIRKRNIWDMFGPETDLRERTITPSDETLFPEYDWLIGNHSDELTPWIPVIAARSSPTCKFFVLPCCAWDFTCKFNTKKFGLSVYQNYLHFVEQVVATCGFEPERDALRIPSTKKICFVGRTRLLSEAETNIRINNLIDSRKFLQISHNSLDSQKSKAQKSHKQIKNQNEPMDNANVKQRDNNDMSVIQNTSSSRDAAIKVPSTNIHVDNHSNLDEPMDTSSALVQRSSPKEDSATDSDDNQFGFFFDKKRAKLDKINETVANYVNRLSQESSDDNINNDKNKGVTIETENQTAASQQNEGLPVSNSWVPSFKARQFEDESTSHCASVNVELKERIVSTVFKALLEEKSSPEDDDIVTAEGHPWKRGGRLPLGKVVQLFDKATMADLKKECGGLQTLLRNHHHVFHVQGGCVRLRDWTQFAEFDAMQTQKKKRRGLTAEKIAEVAAARFKTQLCYNNEHHPDGCPLKGEDCRFAHGAEDLKKTS